MGRLQAGKDRTLEAATSALPRVVLLPYDPPWIAKRRALGLDLPYAHAEWMPPAEVERCAQPFRRAGLEVRT